MTKWFVAAAVALVVPGGLVVLAIAWWSRHREHGEAQYVARINDWYAKEPAIRPLALPAVRPLRAHLAQPTLSRVRRFDERIHGRGAS